MNGIQEVLAMWLTMSVDRIVPIHLNIIAVLVKNRYSLLISVEDVNDLTGAINDPNFVLKTDRLGRELRVQWTPENHNLFLCHLVHLWSFLIQEAMRSICPMYRNLSKASCIYEWTKFSSEVIRIDSKCLFIVFWLRFSLRKIQSVTAKLFHKTFVMHDFSTQFRKYSEVHIVIMRNADSLNGTAINIFGRNRPWSRQECGTIAGTFEVANLPSFALWCESNFFTIFVWPVQIVEVLIIVHDNCLP